MTMRPITSLRMAGAIAIVLARLSLDAAESAAPAPADPRTVTLTGEQAHSLRIVPTELRPFRAEQAATGHMTFNEARTTPVFPPYAGHVLRLIAKPGDAVEAGAPLLELDAPDLVQAEADLWASLPAVAKASSALDHARRNEERQHHLYESKAAALKDWEQAQADTQSAASDLAAAQAALTAARDKLRLFGKTDDEIAAVEGKHQVDRLITVRAPIAGTVTSRKVGPGQYVKTDNPDPLFTISDLSTMWMLANVYETDVPHVAVGQAVEVRLLAFPGTVFKARVDYISPSVDPATHRVPVRCVIDNPDRSIKADMFASFTIITAESASSPAVPATAVVRDGDQQIIWVAKDDKTFVRRPVEIGLQRDGQIQILAGLRPDERVVASGALFLSDP